MSASSPPLSAEAPPGALRPDASAADFIAVARRLRPLLAASAAAVDAGAPLQPNLDLIGEAGLHRLRVPRRFGGLAPEIPFADLPDLVEIQTELAAGESSTAHVWQVNMLVRNLFHNSRMPEASKAILAREILEEHARSTAPTAEAGTYRYTMRTRCTPVPGGILLNGEKKYGTGCIGARYALATALWDESMSHVEDGVHFAVPRLDAPGVTIHDDWDQMGQRGTGTNSITYKDVFVPDGWHWHSERSHGANDIAADTVMGLVAQMFFTAAILGCGLGALDAMREALRERTRPADTAWSSPLEDSGIQHATGDYAAKLAAARALTREAACEIARFARDGGNRAEASILMMEAKIAATDATLFVATDMFRHCGARVASNALRMDRFWRNARTLTLHDPVDVKYRHIGQWVLAGQEPPVSSIS